MYVSVCVHIYTYASLQTLIYGWHVVELVILLVVCVLSIHQVDGMRMQENDMHLWWSHAHMLFFITSPLILNMLEFAAFVNILSCSILAAR